jgi:phosphate transport system permease protein
VRSETLTPQRAGAAAAAFSVVAALAAVLGFLLIQGWPALSAGLGELPSHAENMWQLAGPLVFGSVLVAAIAMLFALPVALGTALYLVFYAPKRVATVLGGALDLLAAVPSVVYGLWGIMVLAPALAGPYAWLNENLGWIPFFAGEASATGRTALTAALVLAVMVLPLTASVIRSALALVPEASIEGAYALGATRWETIKLAALPFARRSIVAGSMLGLGRALGETMAVAMVLSPTPFLIGIKLLTSENPNTVAAYLAQTFPESHGIETSALIALGLALFAITCAVNSLARWITREKTK